MNFQVWETVEYHLCKLSWMTKKYDCEISISQLQSDLDLTCLIEKYILQRQSASNFEFRKKKLLHLWFKIKITYFQWYNLSSKKKKQNCSGGGVCVAGIVCLVM